MSVKKNIIYNYIGQFYTMGISILILPLFLKVIGPEAYGIIAFFMMAQGWMTILDMGMSPTLNREIAANKDTINNEKKKYQLLTLIKSLKVLFLVISLLLVIFSYIYSDSIAEKWLSYNVLSDEFVSLSILLIGIIISIRWLGGLYRSAINGYEEQVWLNKFNIAFTTLKHPVSLAVLYFLNSDLLIFFYYQLMLSLAEVLFLSAKLTKCLPKYEHKIPFFSIQEILRIKSFAGITAVGAILWVFLTQFDRLLMSKYLTLEEFGYFSLVVTISSGIMMLSGPVSTAILPRLTALYNSDNRNQMVELFIKATSLVSVTILPIAVMIICMPETILYFWTGNLEVASWGQEALAIYSIGSLCVVYSAFLHYIQFANGNLKYHLRYSLVSSLISIPLIYYSAVHYSIFGVATVWLLRSAIGLFFWAPFVFYKFLPGYYKKWILNGFLYYLVIDTFFVVIVRDLISQIDERLFLSICFSFLLSSLFLINFCIYRLLNRKRV